MLISHALLITLAFPVPYLVSIEMHSENVRLFLGILGLLPQVSHFTVSISKVLV